MTHSLSTRDPRRLDLVSGAPRPRADEDDEDEVYYIPVPRIIEQTERGERVVDLREF